MKYFLIYSDLVLHPRAILRAPDDLPDDLLERYLERRNLRPLSVPRALLTLTQKLGPGTIRKIQIQTPSLFKNETQHESH